MIACRLAEAFPDLTILIVEHGGDIQGDERTKREHSNIRKSDVSGPLDGMFRYKENSPESGSEPSSVLTGKSILYRAFKLSIALGGDRLYPSERF